MSTSFRGGILSTNGRVFTCESSGQGKELSVLSEPCTNYQSTVSLVRPERKISVTALLSGYWTESSPHKLQLMADLTLAQTIQTVRQSEEVAAQVSLQGDTAGSVQEVQFKRKNTNWKPQQRQQGKSRDRKWGGNYKKCGKCGKTQHNKDEKCYAEKATCHNCHKVGHWARVCHSSKSVNEVTETERAEQTSYFLGSVCKAKETSEQWTVQLQVDSTPIEFKIDTGADVTVMSEDAFHTLTPERTLAPPDIPLESPGGELLCLGRLEVTASHKGKDYPFTAYVVRGHRVNNLLSRTLSVKMNLVRRVDEVKSDACHLQAYGEHGTLKTEPVKIELKDDAVPYAVHTARRVPFPMLQKVKEELKRMENRSLMR